MSRLDSFIRRMTAQRDLIDHAATLLDRVPGPVVDLGLGAGRTYDHLRERLPGRPVYAFDLFVESAREVLPAPEMLVLGDIRETLPHALPRIGARAALLHNDLGSGDAVHNAATAAWLSPLVDALVTPGGIVLTSFPLALPRAARLPLPPGIREGRYHIYRQGDGARVDAAPDAA